MQWEEARQMRGPEHPDAIGLAVGHNELLPVLSTTQRSLWPPETLCKERCQERDVDDSSAQGQ